MKILKGSYATNFPIMIGMHSLLSVSENLEEIMYGWLTTGLALDRNIPQISGIAGSCQTADVDKKSLGFTNTCKYCNWYCWYAWLLRRHI